MQIRKPLRKLQKFIEKYQNFKFEIDWTKIKFIRLILVPPTLQTVEMHIPKYCEMFEIDYTGGVFIN